MSPSFSPPASPPDSPPGDGPRRKQTGMQPDTQPDMPHNLPPSLPPSIQDDTQDGAELSRIAKAGRLLRAEAARTLDRRRPPGRRRVPARQEPKPPPGLEMSLSPAERAGLAEVLDASGRPLVCLPLETALRQGLCVRRVVVALRTRQNKIVLHKRAPHTASPASAAKTTNAAKAARSAKNAASEAAGPGRAGVWSLHVGVIRVGEAQEDSAERLLLEEAALSGLTMHLLIREDDGPGGNRALFVAELPPGLYPLHPAGEFLEVDADELAGLVRDAADLLALETHWAAGVPGLFR